LIFPRLSIQHALFPMHLTETGEQSVNPWTRAGGGLVVILVMDDSAWLVRRR